MDRFSSKNSLLEPVLERPAPARHDRRLSPRLLTTLAAIASSILILLIYVLRLDPAVGVFRDDGWYMVLAKSLATGHGFNLINFPHSGHYFYPPFYPFLVSLLYRFWPDFPNNVALLKSVSVAAMLLLAVVVFRLFNRPDRLPRSLAFLLAACTALAPAFVFMATSTLMSECLFAALQFSALLFAERCIDERQAPGARHPWLTALLVTAAYLTRVAALATLAAIALEFLRRKMFKQLATLIATFLLIAASWATYSHYFTSPNQVVPGYAAQFWQSRAGRGGPQSGFRDLPARVWRQSTVILADDIGVLFAPALYRSGSESGEELMNMPDVIPWLSGHSRRVLVCNMGLGIEVQLVSVVFSIVLLAGFIASVRRRLGLLELVFVSNVALILLWPWDPIRFLVPLFPLLLYYLILGLAEISRLLRTTSTRLGQLDLWSASRIVTVCILGLFLFDHASYLMARRAGPDSPAYPDWLHQFHSQQRAANWVRNHTATTDLVAGHNLPFLYLYSQRQTEPCEGRECLNKGVRYFTVSDSIQSLDGKVVFESGWIKVLDLQTPPQM